MRVETLVITTPRPCSFNQNLVFLQHGMGRGQMVSFKHKDHACDTISKECLWITYNSGTEPLQLYLLDQTGMVKRESINKLFGLGHETDLMELIQQRSIRPVVSPTSLLQITKIQYYKMKYCFIFQGELYYIRQEIYVKLFLSVTAPDQAGVNHVSVYLSYIN